MYFNLSDSILYRYPQSEIRKNNTIYLLRPDTNKEYIVVKEFIYPHMILQFIKPILLDTTFIYDTIVFNFCLINKTLFQINEDFITNMITLNTYNCNIDKYIIYNPKFESKL